MSTKKRLGEILVESGLISEADCNRAVKMQVGGNRRLGRILVKMGALSSDQLLDCLATQFDLPIIDISRTYSPEVASILPRFICQKYDVFPLSIDHDNILKVAMSDPSDSEAISDIELYTGKVVQPCLARQIDIQQAVKQYTQFRIHDLFNQHIFSQYSKVASTAALALLLVSAIFTYQFYKSSKYGTVTQTSDTTIYKNHDLMVGLEKSGKATLLGRGTYASGYYSITFESLDLLDKFIEKKRQDLSSDQYEWTKWAISKNK